MTRSAAGFTLLELIIVIAIFAIFSVMAYGGLNSVLQTRAQVERAQDRLAEQQRAYLRLRDDLQQVLPRPTRDGYGELQPALRGGESPTILEFTRAGWRNPAMLQRSTLERVLYRVEDQQLIRATFRVLDQSQDSKAIDAVLLTGVESMTLRYLDDQQEWRNRWPPDSADISAARQPPPRAIEVGLQTKDQGTLTFLFKVGADHIRVLPSAGSNGAPPRADDQGGQDSGPPAPSRDQEIGA